MTHADEPSSTSDPLVGTEVERYRIVRHLGTGGMGAVYVADDSTLGRQVALKAIRRDRRINAEVRLRFQREARALSRLDHPHVCRIHDYIRGETHDFLVLELIEGTTLGAWARAGAERRQVLRAGLQVASALVAAHAQGIVHRDLKPGNVMVTDDGQAKVLDFGLAGPSAPQAVDSKSSKQEREPGADGAPATATSWSGEVPLTMEGTVSGTLRYMSPEQAKGQSLTTASDVYSLGLILQELLSGEAAYPTGLDTMELWSLAKEGDARSFEDRDRELRALIARMRSLAPAQRPTAEDVVARLERIRSRPRRRAFQAAGVAVFLAAAGGATKYVMDLGRERNAALLARDEADTRRTQAEDLLGFLVEDLRGKLEPLGRLELLDDVGARALAYFENIPDAIMSDEERLRRSQVTYQVGELRRLRGDLPEARRMYQLSLEIIESLASRDPVNLDWLMALGASQFYVGHGLLEQGSWDEARSWLEEYLATSERGFDLANGSREWHMELAYAQTNLGALEMGRLNFGASLFHFDHALAAWRSMHADAPDDAAIMIEVADILSWHGTARLRLDQLEDARGSFEEERDLRELLLLDDPHNAILQGQLATCENFLCEISILRAQPTKALDHHERAMELQESLVQLTPDNTNGRREYAMTMYWGGKAMKLADRAHEARALFQAAQDELSALTQRDPTNATWKRDLFFVNQELDELPED